VLGRVRLHREIKARHITAWVQNRKDGSLEAILQGEKSAVALLVTWVKRDPIDARADRVNST